MKISGLLRLLAAAVAVVVSALLLSSAGNAADAFERRTTTQVPLSDTAGQWTEILQVTVPAGAWIVHAKATIVNFASPDLVRCRVRADQTQIDLSTNAFGGGLPVYTLVNQGTITTTLTRGFIFECEHDGSVSGIYVDPDASLVVARAPADAFERRAKIAVPLSDTGGQWTKILQVTVPAGAWIVHAKASAVNFSSPDIVRCRVRVSQRQIDVSANMFGFSFYSVYTLVNQATISTSLTRIFIFECEHDGSVSGISVDSGASLIVIPAPADAFEHRLKTYVSLPDTGAQWTKILQVIVPAGAWIVHAKATVNYSGVPDLVRCRVRVGLRQVDVSTTTLGSGAFGVRTLVNQGTITTTLTRVFTFECEHDTTFSPIAMTVDPGASLIVVRAPGPIS